ncbi:MAG: hypothetical protein KME26_25765 [Oscillatoria princeps RMCB-10]|nr:hypothetical protein [Oscillatoria princeps RMCB-10]
MDRIDKQLQHFPDRRKTTCQPDALASIATKQRQRSRSLVWLGCAAQLCQRAELLRHAVCDQWRQPHRAIPGWRTRRGQRRVKALQKTSVPNRWRLGLSAALEMPARVEAAVAWDWGNHPRAGSQRARFGTFQKRREL